MSGSSPSSGTSGSASKSAAPASKGSAGKGRDESGVITLYLILYNAAAALGWAYVDYVIFDHFVLKKEGADTLYRDVGYPLKVVQTMAILEVVHAMLRFVRSSVAITAIQVASRLAVLWGITHYSPPSQTSPFFALMVCSWAAVEVPRYAWYIAEGLKSPNSVLTWLRYSLFLVLYPSGIAGEMGSLWVSLPFFKEQQQSLGLAVEPGQAGNTWNWAYSHHFILTVLFFAVYPIGSYVMIGNMWSQRKKKLGGGDDKKGKKE